MATAAQINANRANAQRCTGPKTPEGKAASSANATRHGLCSIRVLLPGEDPAEFEAMRDGFYAEYQPETETEHTLTNAVAEWKWRLLRAERIEAEATAQILAQPEIDEKRLAKLGSYVSTILRDMNRTITQLRKVRAERLKVQETELHVEIMQRTSQSDAEFDEALANLRSQFESTTSEEIGFVSENAPKAATDESATKDTPDQSLSGATKLCPDLLRKLP